MIVPVMSVDIFFAGAKQARVLFHAPVSDSIRYGVMRSVGFWVFFAPLFCISGVLAVSALSVILLNRRISSPAQRHSLFMAVFALSHVAVERAGVAIIFAKPLCLFTLAAPLNLYVQHGQLPTDERDGVAERIIGLRAQIAPARFLIISTATAPGHRAST